MECRGKKQTYVIKSVSFTFIQKCIRSISFELNAQLPADFPFFFFDFDAKRKKKIIVISFGNVFSFFSFMWMLWNKSGRELSSFYTSCF